jgi:aryl-alcohol dehydrogenase-like predicted oxidoreductase
MLSSYLYYFMSGKYAREDCPKTSRLNLFEGLMPRYKQSIAQDAVKEYCDIATKHDLTPTELALAWCYKQKHVASSIIGATSIPQLRENLNSYGKIHVVDDKVIAEINDVYKRYRDPSRM